MKRYLIVGGAGFIGSHLATKLFREEKDIEIVIYDNFSSGKKWHLEEIIKNKNLTIVEADIKELNKLIEASKGIDYVYHFASNPDIAKAVTQPDIDFWEGTYLTNNVIEAMRINGIKNLLYASGSGVYGDTGYTEANEDYSPMLPISTYGASKLACEALICSYSYMFDINAAAFRFANVVGPHQTHGVGYDFVKRLLSDDTKLDILGDGTQSKSYIYVDDILNAMRNVEKNHLKKFNYFNVATLDYITVTEIAEIVCELLELRNVNFQYSGGDRGWKGDVPIVRLNSEKIRGLGWKNKLTANEAIRKSLSSIIEDARNDKFCWEVKSK